jgi:hypothetical protein
MPAVISAIPGTKIMAGLAGEFLNAVADELAEWGKALGKVSS